MTQVFKAITVWQPWASLIAIGAKPYEFRSWPIPASLVGKPLGIHAGARPLKKAEITGLLTRLSLPDEAWTTGLRPEIAIPFLERLRVNPSMAPQSHMMCVVTVGTPKRAYEIAEEFGGAINDSDRDEHANWAWPMLDVQPLVPPRYMKGVQGLWNWGGP